MPSYRITFEVDDTEGMKILASLHAQGIQPHVEVLEPAKRTPVTKNAGRAASVDVTTRVENWAEFLALLTPGQLDVLKVIKASPQGVTSNDIAASLGKEPSQITGSLGGGLRKNIPKAGYEDDHIIVSTKIGGVWTYSPGPVLMARDLE